MRSRTWMITKKCISQWVPSHIIPTLGGITPPIRRSAWKIGKTWKGLPHQKQTTDLFRYLEITFTEMMGTIWMISLQKTKSGSRNGSFRLESMTHGTETPRVRWYGNFPQVL